MSVMLHETWTALDGRLVFEFSIPARAAADDVCLVRVLDSTMPAGAITLEIHGSQPCTCSCRFETGLRVQGSLCRVPDVHVDDRRCIGIRAELYFGLPTQIDDIRFEGLMVACPVPGHTRPFVPEPSALPVADAPPVSDVLLAPSDCVAAWPGADAPEPALPVRIDSRLTDLFPYVWTRRWPQTEPADLRDGFVQFSPSRWPDCPFWETLVAARAQGRVAVQAAALRFISGRAAGSSDFVASLGQIVGPVRRFAALAQLLVALDAGSPTWPAQVARKIASVLRHEHETVAYFGSPAYQRVLDRVWQSYFATLITLGWNPALRAGLQRVLWVAHLVDRVLVLDPPSPAGEVPAVQALTAEQIQLLHGASILLPEPVFPLPSAGGAQASPPAGHVPGWVEPYAIGDLQMVRQRLLRYRTGEVARIENIMPGERREVSHRRSRQQLDQVQLQSSDGEHFQDEGGDKRSDLLEAVRKTVAEQSVTQHYQDFKTSYGPPTQATLDGQWTRTTKPGTEAGLQDLTRFAREVLDKTVHRIHRSISQQRIRSTLDQHEEEVRSTVDNTNNAHGRNVVYRWLNEVHEAQVVHYGRRLMLEFVLNRPAAHFIATSAALWGEDWLRPVPLDQLGVASFRDITPDNYAGLAARYGVTEVSPAPTATLYVSAVLRDDQQKLLPIPDGYQVEDAFVRSANASQPAVMPTVLIGRHVIDPRAPSIGVPRHFGEEMAIPVAVVAAQPVALSPPVEAVQCLVNVEVRCCPTARHLDRWRIDTHAALLQAYRAALTRHEERLRGTVAGHRSLQSAAARRDTERREIQRGCLQLLIERAERQVGDGSPPGSFWELEPRYLQFLDTALEWREMSYSFYASIRGTAPAVVGVQNVGDDAMFASFLQAGSARVLLPVTPDQVLAFLFFLSSGQLWEEIDTTAPICPGDALPVLELKKNPATRPDACRIGECWEFEVPTSMQMVTAESEFGLGEMK